MRENFNFLKSDVSSRVLKVSQFSKSFHDYTDFESKKSDKSRAMNSTYSEPLQKSSKSPQILRVLDVVPKVLDQTIGIPVKNPSHFRSGQNTFLNSDIHSNSYHFSQTLPDFHGNEPQVIHHPLVSGNIPATFDNVHNSRIQDSKAPKSTGSSNHQKRENGERNKVKFCNTVTVAVVPVSFYT